MNTKLGTKQTASEKGMKFNKVILGLLIVVLLSLTTLNPARANENQPQMPAGNNPLVSKSDQPVSIVPSKGLMSPSYKNFEYVAMAVAMAINTANVTRLDGNFDPTDLTEDYSYFSYQKYQEVQAGKRVYKYIHLETYWDDKSSNLPNIRAVVIVPHSEDNHDAVEYFNQVLAILQNQYQISTDKIGKLQKQQIINDVANASRFTCVRVLRFIWLLFGNDAQNTDGLFPQVFQLNFVKAGELSHFVAGGFDLFSAPNILQPALLQNSVATNYDPENKPELFDNKIAVFFRPSRDAQDTGHVGIAQIFSDVNGSTVESKISYVDVNGDTGMAKFVSRMDINAFRNHLYGIADGSTTQKPMIGWYLHI
jgi:hypothetical protein